MAKHTNTNMNFAGSVDGDLIPVPALSTSFTVAYTVASAATTDILATETGLGGDQIILRITATTDCFITSAAAPTAVADGTNHYLAAGVPQDIRFPSTHKIAAIRSAVDGSIYCTALV